MYFDTQNLKLSHLLLFTLHLQPLTNPKYSLSFIVIPQYVQLHMFDVRKITAIWSSADRPVMLTAAHSHGDLKVLDKKLQKQFHSFLS